MISPLYIYTCLICILSPFWVSPLCSSHIFTHTLLYLSLRATKAMPASWFHLPPHTLDCISFCLRHQSCCLPLFIHLFLSKELAIRRDNQKYIHYFGKYTLSQLFFSPLHRHALPQLISMYITIYRLTMLQPYRPYRLYAIPALYMCL